MVSSGKRFIFFGRVTEKRPCLPGLKVKSCEKERGEPTDQELRKEGGSFLVLLPFFP